MDDPPVEDQIVGGLAREQLWRTIEDLLHGDQERAVVHGCLVMGFKPAELCQRDPLRFASVKEVYRIKENVLARLRRDPRLKLLFEGA